MYLHVVWGGLCGASGLALPRRRRGRGQARGVVRVGCAEPLAWLCPDEGGAEVRPEAWVVRLVGRAGVLGLPAREGWKVRWKRSASPKPSPLRGSADGWSGWSFCAWLVRVGKCVGRGQAQKPSHCGTACN